VKVVYSFLNVNHPEYVHPEEFKIAIVSAMYANKFYGNSTFASSRAVIDKIKGLKLPFTHYEIIDLDLEKNSLPYIYKMYVYTKQTTPFINLDLDLVLNNPLPEQNTGTVKFAHRDHKIKWEMTQIDGLRRSYFDPASYIYKTHGLDILKNLRLFSIPNMGIVSCEDPDLYRRATNKALQVYYDNKSFFDSELLHGCFIEQGLTHKYLYELSDEYRKQVEDDSTFIFDKSISIVIDESMTKYTINDLYREHAYPFTNVHEALEQYSYKELPAVHFLGSTKYSEVTQFFIIKEIIQNLGVEVLEKIEQYFGPGMNHCFTKYKRLFL